MTANRASLLAGQAELNQRARDLLDRKRVLSLDVTSGDEASTHELGIVLREIDQITRDRGVLDSALEELDRRQNSAMHQGRLAAVDAELTAAQDAISCVLPAYLTALRAGLALKKALADLASAAARATSAEASLAADPRAVTYVAGINVTPSINGMLDAIAQNTPFQPTPVAVVTDALSKADGVAVLESQMGTQVAAALRKVSGGAERKRKAI